MVVETSSVQCWGEIAPRQDGDSISEALGLLDDMKATQYLANEELNFRIALWQGDITELKVDAVVNCNNELLNERAGVSGSLYAVAGPQLEEACTRLGECAPGSARATRGFGLPMKHVIHTVSPQWSDGLEVEAALEACYRASLQICLQLHCTTVAFTCIKSTDAPREQVRRDAANAMATVVGGKVY